MKHTRSLLFLAAFAALPAHADNFFDGEAAQSTISPGFYWGANFGGYKYDLSEGKLNSALTDTLAGQGLTLSNATSDLSKDGFTWDITFGYQLCRWFAVEAAWVDLGSAEYKANGTVSDGITSQSMRSSVKVDSSGATLSALAILPVTKGFDVYARVGGYFGGNDSTATVTINDVTGSADDSSNSNSMLWGVGVGFTRGQWTTRLDYQQILDVGDSNGAGQADVSRITLGAVYRTDFSF